MNLITIFTICLSVCFVLQAEPVGLPSAPKSEAKPGKAPAKPVKPVKSAAEQAMEQRAETQFLRLYLAVNEVERKHEIIRSRFNETAERNPNDVVIGMAGMESGKWVQGSAVGTLFIAASIYPFTAQRFASKSIGAAGLVSSSSSASSLLGGEHSLEKNTKRDLSQEEKKRLNEELNSELRTTAKFWKEVLKPAPGEEGLFNENKFVEAIKNATPNYVIDSRKPYRDGSLKVWNEADRLAIKDLERKVPELDIISILEKNKLATPSQIFSLREMYRFSKELKTTYSDPDDEKLAKTVRFSLDSRIKTIKAALKIFHLTKIEFEATYNELEKKNDPSLASAIEARGELEELINAAEGALRSLEFIKSAQEEPAEAKPLPAAPLPQVGNLNEQGSAQK